MDYNKKQLINGREVSIIATYNDDVLSKDYIIYTDESKNEQGKLNIFYGCYKIVDDEIKVSSVGTKEEERKILEILKVVTAETLEEINSR